LFPAIRVVGRWTAAAHGNVIAGRFSRRMLTFA